MNLLAVNLIHNHHVINQQVLQRNIQVTHVHRAVQNVDARTHLIKHHFAHLLPFQHTQPAIGQITMRFEYKLKQGGSTVLHHQKKVLFIVKKIHKCGHIVVQTEPLSVETEIAQDLHLRHDILFDAYGSAMHESRAALMQTFVRHFNDYVSVEAVGSQRGAPYRSLQSSSHGSLAHRQVVSSSGHRMLHVIRSANNNGSSARLLLANAVRVGLKYNKAIVDGCNGSGVDA
mmetsp:Transcript_8887/g.13726  ORF Transcript_8887/g.13726 Transcript_8887/m.13726 type:complete len:230 (-) Transcript_8887:290-979(-)